MDDKPSRRRAAAEFETSRVASDHLERLRVAVVAALAAGMIAILVFAGAAQGGGSGGISSGGGGGDSKGDRYNRLWDDLPRKQRRWARRTSECESGGDRNIHGGGGTYHGAFQFVLSTWRNSPKSPGGDPHKHRWKVQAVVAVYLKKRDGAKNHWPNCG
jgi:hypothetical protein